MLPSASKVTRHPSNEGVQDDVKVGVVVPHRGRNRDLILQRDGGVESRQSKAVPHCIDTSLPCDVRFVSRWVSWHTSCHNLWCCVNHWLSQYGSLSNSV